MKLYNIAESIILEAVNRNDINDCIDGRRIVEMSYDDNEDPGGKGTRWIQIYTYGVSKANNDVIRAYQVGGDTKTIQPRWKMFRVDRIMNFKKLSGTFDEPKPLFNPNGDKDMIKIYKIIKF